MIKEVIQELEVNRQQRNIQRESIEFITNICKKLKPKYTLEIGTFNGYSALCLSIYSGHVVTIEIDKISAETAKNNFEKAGVKNIELINGDAFEVLQRLFHKFSLVLIDATKSEYKTYLEMVLNIIKDDALIFVDNTISHKDKLDNFFDYLARSKLYYKELNLGRGLMVVSKKQLDPII